MATSSNKGKRKREADARTTDKCRKSGDDHVYVLRWARSTAIGELDDDMVEQGEWVDEDEDGISGVRASLKDELNDVLEDTQHTITAFPSHKHAREARDALMREQINAVRNAVKAAYGLRAAAAEAHWKKILKDDRVVEYSDDIEISDGERPLGVTYKKLGESTLHTHWRERFFTFRGAKHNAEDRDQTHYLMAWGSLNGCDVQCESAASTTNGEPDAPSCCAEIFTHVRCWIETIRLHAPRH